MKKKIISILFILFLIVFYNNSSMHVSKYKLWKYCDHIFEKGYEQKLIFSKDKYGNYLYRYEWPYIYKYDKKIGCVVFCIGDRMWVKYYVKNAKIVKYVGK